MKNLEPMKRPRLIGAVLALALLGGACAGADDVYEVPPGSGPAAAGAEGAFEELSLPPIVPAVPAYVVRSKRPLSRVTLSSLAKVDGAAVVAPFALQRTRTSGRRAAKLTVAFVDPVDFRSVAPPSTRGAEFVWLSLLGGDAVLTEEAAQRVRLGRRPQLKTGLGRLTVGAIADNGTPNIADALIDAAAVESAPKARHAVIGAATGTSLESLARELRQNVKGLKLQRLIPQGEKTVEPPAPSGGGGTVSVPVVAGLHPTMAEAVGRLIAASGGRVYVVSGFRDSQRQYELWVGALQRYGSPEKADDWVARPGHSMHEYGLAVDLGGDVELAARLVDELQLPLWRPMTWEPWHFELVGSRG